MTERERVSGREPVDLLSTVAPAQTDRDAVAGTRDDLPEAARVLPPRQSLQVIGSTRRPIRGPHDTGLTTVSSTTASSIATSA